MDQQSELVLSVQARHGESADTIEGFSKSDVRRNMRACVFLDAAFLMGWADFQLVLQPLLVYLGASNAQIGLALGGGALSLLGVFLSPFITRRFTYKKRYLFGVNIPYIGQILLVSLVLIFHRVLGFDNPQLLKLVFTFVMLQWIFAGFCSLPNQEYISACIPSCFRGRLVGYSLAIGGAAAVVAALAAGWILKVVGRPASFGWVCLISWLIVQFGYIAALFANEQPTPIDKAPKPYSKDMFKRAWADKSFLKVMLIITLVGILVNPVFAFINVYGFKDLKMAVTAAAVFQIIQQVARVVFSVPIGHMVDRLTPQRVFHYSILLGLLSIVTVLVSPSAWGVYVSVAIFSIKQVLENAATMALIFGIPVPEDRTGHFTLQLLLGYGSSTVGPVAMGLLCDHLPYRIVFFVVAGIALVMIPVTKRTLSNIKLAATTGNRVEDRSVEPC